MTSALLKLALRLLLVVAVIYAALQLSDWIKAELNLVVMPHTEAMIYKTILVALAIYTVLMALPFVPGAEIGIVLLTAFGAQVAPAVYILTLLALSVAYTVGRAVPAETTARLLHRLRLTRAANMLCALEAQPPQERLPFLLQEVDAGWIKGVARYRYIALALLLNLPGNVVLGGGGGLALFAGLSKVFHPVPFLATIALAVLPIPLSVLLMG